jgi:hypothetical protein
MRIIILKKGPIFNGFAVHPDIIAVSASTSLNRKAAYKETQHLYKRLEARLNRSKCSGQHPNTLRSMIRQLKIM